MDRHDWEVWFAEICGGSAGQGELVMHSEFRSTISLHCRVSHVHGRDMMMMMMMMMKWLSSTYDCPYPSREPKGKKAPCRRYQAVAASNMCASC